MQLLKLILYHSKNMILSYESPEFSLAGLGRQRSVVSEEQIEVLKQQIAIYAEDFNSEKEEKEKFAEQVKRVTAKLRDTEKKCKSLENEVCTSFSCNKMFLSYIK